MHDCQISCSSRVLQPVGYMWLMHSKPDPAGHLHPGQQIRCILPFQRLYTRAHLPWRAPALRRGHGGCCSWLWAQPEWPERHRPALRHHPPRLAAGLGGTQSRRPCTWLRCHLLAQIQAGCQPLAAGVCVLENIVLGSMCLTCELPGEYAWHLTSGSLLSVMMPASAEGTGGPSGPRPSHPQPPQAHFIESSRNGFKLLEGLQSRRHRPSPVTAAPASCVFVTGGAYTRYTASLDKLGAIGLCMLL